MADLHPHDKASISSNSSNIVNNDYSIEQTLVEYQQRRVHIYQYHWDELVTSVCCLVDATAIQVSII